MWAKVIYVVKASEQYLTISDGTRIFVASWLPDGEAERAVLCIHGLCENTDFFSNLGSYLAIRGDAAYALDLRGNGLSGRWGDVENISHQLEDIKLVLELVSKKHQGKPTYLLGHGLGAGYVLWFATTYGEMVSGLVLLSPAVDLLIERFFGTALSKLRASLSPKEYWDVTQAWTPPFSQSNFANAVLTNPKSVKRYTYRYIASLSKVDGSAMLKYAKDVSHPTLIIQGEEDTLVSPEGAKKLYEALASEKKQLVMVEDADHDLLGLLLPTEKYLTRDSLRVAETVHYWMSKKVEGES